MAQIPPGSDALSLPFPVADDGTLLRAPIAGVVSGLRAAANDVCLFLPVDCPLVSARSLLRLAGACADAAIPQTGPLPGAYRRTALPALERSLLAGKLALRDALKAVELRIVELDPAELVNVNTKADLQMLKRAHA